MSDSFVSSTGMSTTKPLTCGGYQMFVLFVYQNECLLNEWRNEQIYLPVENTVALSWIILFIFLKEDALVFTICMDVSV